LRWRQLSSEEVIIRGETMNRMTGGDNRGHNNQPLDRIRDRRRRRRRWRRRYWWRKKEIIAQFARMMWRRKRREKGGSLKNKVPIPSYFLQASTYPPLF